MRVVTAFHGLNKWVLHAQASRKFTVGSVIQRDPVGGTAELRRKETAAQLLRLLSGRSLEDPIRVRAKPARARPLLLTASFSAIQLLYRKKSCLLLCTSCPRRPHLLDGEHSQIAFNQLGLQLCSRS